MPPERSRPRQEPSSCESCRKKKLKCDRAQPCSNCQARSLQCIFQGRPAAFEHAPSTPASSHDLQAENAAIRTRLRRLETAIFGTTPYVGVPTNGRQQSPDELCASTPLLRGDRQDQLTATSAQMTTSPTTNTTCPEAEHVKAHSAESRWLEAIGNHWCMSSLPHLSGRPSIRVESLQSLAVQTNAGCSPAHVLLPTWEDALLFTDAYRKHVDTLQHVIYVPHVKEMIHSFYMAIDNGQEVNCSQASLILAICSTVVGYWFLGERKTYLFESTNDMLNVSMFWCRCSLDTLTHGWRTEAPCLESLQACIILVFFLYQMEGYSPKLRTLHAAAIAHAREMGLHLTDSIHHKRSESTQADIIDMEMRRRIWWHLASTEWSSSLVGGASEGVYSVDPKHMRVKRPRNISDEDLVDKPANFDRPISEATPSTYYLQRIRLAELCREVADITWELAEVMDPVDIAYKRIIATDAKFDALLEQLPQALRIDSHSANAHHPAYQTFVPLAKQKYFNYLSIMVRRAKLHLPFLIRASQDSRYIFSRQTCLRCARAVLELKHVLPTSTSEKNNNGPRQSGDLLGTLHHSFFAVLVLTMDLCVNKDDEADDARRIEIKAACQIFDKAKGYSSAADTFFQSLLAVLKKHRLSLQHTGPVSASPTDLMWPAGDSSYPLPSLDDANLDFAEVWSTYFDFDTSVAPQGWDALFGDLDMQML